MVSKLFRHFIFLFLFVVIAPLLTFAEDNKISELACFIEPYITVNLGSGVTGILKEISVERGDFVKKGQVLVRLDSSVEESNLALTRARSEMVATIEARKARLNFAAREHNRKEDLYKKEIITLDEIDEAETNKIIAERELQEAIEQQHIASLELKQALDILERRIIRSPINGVVTEKFLSIGELVNEQPILKLAQLDPLNVEVIAPITLLNSVKVGDKSEVIPEKPIEGSYIGIVKIVDRVVDAGSGTFGIRIELSNPNYTLPAGLKCNVRFLNH